MTQFTMRAVLLSGLLLGAAAPLPVLGDDVPFAAPPPPGLGQSSDANLTSLGDIMATAQWRHIKLWYAIKSRNWPLLNYELVQLKDSFDKAALLYRNLPVEFIGAVVKPLLALQDSVKAKDEAKFERAFADLTTACNSCHQAAQVDFIAIKTPTSSPFSDQNFTPQK